MSTLNIYYHKDFDGIVAAALFLRINQESQLIGADSINLKPVDYDIKNDWLKMHLEKPNVVLDFLYHPKADWWFDHHVSTFIDSKHEKRFKNTTTHYWDTHVSSCATLILNNLENQCSLFMGQKEFSNIVDSFREWIKWSGIIDNAKYESPKQIVEMNNACLQINATLTNNVESEYLSHLIIAAKMYSPKEVAQTSIVKKRIETVMNLQSEYISKFKDSFVMISNISFYDYVKNEMPFQRYLTYYFEPDADYSIGVYKRNDNYAISVGKNPWKEFRSVNLGDLCKKFGGGGRMNVGSIITLEYSKAIEISNMVIKTLTI